MSSNAFRPPTFVANYGGSEAVEAMREVTSRDSCAKCLKICGDGERHLICSACRTAAYCSKDCQRSHWKEHKGWCKAKQAAKKSAKEQGMKREFRLLEQWKSHARNGVLGYVCLSLFGFDTLKSLSQEVIFVSLTVEFNYNKRTFLPVEKPELVPIDVMDQANPQFAAAIRQTYKDIEATNPTGNTTNKANVLILLTVEGGNTMGSIMPLVMETPTSPLAKANWDDLLVFMSDIRLTSGIFDSWLPLLNDNHKQQLEVVRRHPQFQPFLVNALRIETSKDTRHKTHIVTVFVEMGPGLGQVVAIKDYQVWPVSKVKASFAAYKGKLFNQQQLDYYNTHLFDLENSPTLLQTRVQHPHNALLPVVFVAKDTSIFVMPSFSEVSPNHQCFTASKCDKKARKAFQQLLQIKFPPVVSPELK